MTVEVLIGVREVLRQAGIGRTYLYVLMARGEFPRPHSQVGRQHRWRQSLVQAWIGQRAQTEAQNHEPAHS